VRTRTSRLTPNRSLLPIAFQPVLNALDHEIETLSARIDSVDLLAREVPSLLSEPSDTDERHLRDDHVSDVRWSRSTPRSSRWRGLVPVAMVAAVVGISSSTWAFRALQKRDQKPEPTQVLVESPVMRPFQFAMPGYTANLCYQSGVRREPEKATGVYLRGPANALVIIKATFDAEPVPSEPVTGKVININGKRGLVISQASQRPTVVRWRIGRTDTRVIGVHTDERALIAVARSVKLQFDQDGAEIQSFSAPGFTQDFYANSSLSSSFLSYGPCGVVTESANPKAPRFMISTSTAWPIIEQLGTDFKEVRVPYPLVWDGRPITGSRVTRTYRQQSGELIAWTDSGTDFELTYGNLSSGEVDQIVRGLMPTSQVAFDELLRGSKHGTRSSKPSQTPPTASPT
jgi:hypothetical protein